MNVLVWFKRDLRICDHPALSLAAGLGRVLPVHVIDPEEWCQSDRSGRQWEFVSESLQDLRRNLAASGAPLVVRVGETQEVLAKLCHLHRIDRILSLSNPEGSWGFLRDTRLAAWARDAGIDWQVLTEGSADAPALTAVAGVEPGMVPAARALRLAEDRCAHRQTGGRATGLMLMEGFFAQRGAGYRAGVNSPVLAERASSRLSPYLAQGCLSPQEVTAALLARQAERPGPPWGASLSAFAARLADRSALIARAGRDMAVADGSDASRLAAWEAGETGLPFLDACMRYLTATGWLNFRLRRMILAVATGQLGLAAQAAGLVLARRFTDYSPALHWPLVAQIAGLLGPCPRIDPLREGKLLDPTGGFIRRWLPELGPVPDAFVHEPWKWSGAQTLLGRRYPEAVIDPASATRALRAPVQQSRSPKPVVRLAARNRMAHLGQLGFEF